MSENDRQQRMVERILEDERLRGDLEDPAATALVNWASERAAAAAADPARPDDAVEAMVQAVRAAARSAARSGESDPQRLIAHAEAALAQHKAAPTAPAPVAAAPAAPAAVPQPGSGTTTAPAPAVPAIVEQPGAGTAQAQPAEQQPAPPARPRTAAMRARAGARPGRGWSRFTGWLKRLRKDR